MKSSPALCSKWNCVEEIPFTASTSASVALPERSPGRAIFFESLKRKLSWRNSQLKMKKKKRPNLKADAGFPTNEFEQN